RVMSLAKQVHDRFVERFPVVTVALSDVDAHENPLTRQSMHISSASPEQEDLMPGSEPRVHRRQRDQDTQQQIGCSSRIVAVAEQVDGFEREGGEGGVTPTKDDGKKCPDFGVNP